jgi:isohexenylglutaconyl-CoA hydratase
VTGLLPHCDTLLLRREGTRLHVTLNRPETKNALSGEVVQELQRVVEFLENAIEVGTVVLRGAGATFCAGGDNNGFMAQLNTPVPRPGEKDPVAVQNRRFGAFLQRFDALPQTIVTVIEGAAFGGGLGLAAVGDIAICRADARLAMSETGLGIVPAQIAPFVAARVGVPEARRLALSGERFDGREAWRIGLVHHLCEDAAALEATLSRVLGAIGRCAPGANAATKRLLLTSRTTALDTLLDQAADAFAAALRGAEGREGVTAFIEKRPASWVDTSGKPS